VRLEGLDWRGLPFCIARRFAWESVLSASRCIPLGWHGIGIAWAETLLYGCVLLRVYPYLSCWSVEHSVGTYDFMIGIHRIEIDTPSLIFCTAVWSDLSALLYAAS
jgi:hypothetical protein